MLRHSLVLVMLATLSGCGTLVKLIDLTERYTAYAGTDYDWQMAQQWGLPILDLPLSFLLDTALLPYAWSN
ncbi:lipoprotein [Haemophilus pittmaniae]|uniref:Lipoprotein n=1 Tax=Haemophilus pittmaniae TaxID=249188 RepID=A0A377IWS2_9PAST|nr:YceK/YidQ family lipoprotein [Haemophilus pittmaniae]STO92559.1 lipoprotein [Haemophilus pittmaniae]